MVPPVGFGVGGFGGEVHARQLVLGARPSTAKLIDSDLLDFLCILSPKQPRTMLMLWYLPNAK